MVRVIRINNGAVDADYQVRSSTLQLLVDQQGCDACAHRAIVPNWAPQWRSQGCLYIFACSDHAAAIIALLEADVALGGLTSPSV